MMYQPLHEPQIVYAHADHILPSSDADYYDFPRIHPFAYGSVELGGVSAYTDYTFDAQQISTPAGTGYHYRYVVRQGLSYP